MITIVICNKNKVALGNNIWLDLPASGYDIQDVFEKLAISNSNDCRLNNVITNVPELDALFIPMLLIAEDIPKLNVLATVLNGLNSEEMGVFSSLLHKFEPQTIDEIVCIACRINEDEERCENCNHCRDGKIVDAIFESICEKHDRVVFDICLMARQQKENQPQSASELLPMAKAVLKHEIELLSCFKTHVRTLHAIPVILSLPATRTALDIALASIGVHSFAQTTMVDLKSRHKFLEPMFASDTDILLLNDFAKILINMDIDTFCKYKAVLEYNGIIAQNKPPSIRILIALARNLDCYDFTPLKDVDEHFHQPRGCYRTSYGFLQQRKQGKDLAKA